MSADASFTQRFSTYFDREIARKAASSLANGVEIEFQVEAEKFTFTKSGGKNQIKAETASAPQLIFRLTPLAAEAILGDPTEDLGAIGVNIMKLVISPDANRRVQVKFKAGFLTLFSKGYFGVLTAGGAPFAAYLASRGLSGMGAIKAALKKVKE